MDLDVFPRIEMEINLEKGAPSSIAHEEHQGVPKIFLFFFIPFSAFFRLVFSSSSLFSREKKRISENGNLFSRPIERGLAVQSPPWDGKRNDDVEEDVLNRLKRRPLLRLWATHIESAWKRLEKKPPNQNWTHSSGLRTKKSLLKGLTSVNGPLLITLGCLEQKFPLTTFRASV